MVVVKLFSFSELSFCFSDSGNIIILTNEFTICCGNFHPEGEGRLSKVLTTNKSSTYQFTLRISELVELTYRE